MGAFDGYYIPFRGYFPPPEEYTFIKGQPQFKLSKNFTLENLKTLLAAGF